jgi:hypothetical protein
MSLLRLGIIISDKREASGLRLLYGLNGVLIPDHVPRLSRDTCWGHQASDFCHGYINVLIQVVDSSNCHCHTYSLIK